MSHATCGARKARERSALHRTNQQGRFYTDVLQGFSQLNRARIYELYLDDRLAASRLCIHDRKHQLIILKTTFDETLREFSPGWLMLYLLLEREFAKRDFEMVEFYTNQQAWATHTRPIYHLVLYRNALVQGSSELIKRLRGRAVSQGD